MVHIGFLETGWASDSRCGWTGLEERRAGEVCQSGDRGRSYMKRFHRLDKLARRARGVALWVVEDLTPEVAWRRLAGYQG